MKAGLLRQRIMFQQSGPDLLDPAGDKWGATGVAEAWTGFATVWASVIARVETEMVKDEGVSAVTTYDVTCRYLPNITSENRIAWCGKVLEIVAAIDPDGCKRSLKIEAKELT